MATKLIGQNYTSPDLMTKVTGRSKYAEDYRADGMLFTKLLLSPMPHCRVRGIDTSEALKLPGVMAILTADELPVIAPPKRGAAAAEEEGPASKGGKGSPIKAEMGLTNEPVFQGDPILAVAAIDETTAADAIALIKLDLEPLPFCVDPLQSLKPGGPNARTEGNVYYGDVAKTLKWTEDDWKEVEAGRLPLREAPDMWTVGDVDAGMKEADLVIDETVLCQATSHQCMEPRTSMAYWQNGKLYLCASAQSTAHVSQSIGNWSKADRRNVVLFGSYVGGGFGGKNPETQMHTGIPAMLAKKTGRPVMMRISREEDNYIGRSRAGMIMRVRMGFRKDGRMTALDMFLVQANGPYARAGDYGTCAVVASANYTPLNMRFRGTTVLTNTPPHGPQRGPGGVQAMVMFEPLISQAARKLGIDEVEIRKINAPTTGMKYGAPDNKGKQSTFTSAYGREALTKGAEKFNWAERSKRNGQLNGTKLTGIGVSLANFTAGTIGFDGLVVITPEGKLQIHSGVGNIGTLSVFDTARVAAEFLDVPWDKCEVIWGDTSQHLPFSSRQGGSQTTHATSRANRAAAEDAKQKLQEIAAQDHGGKPEDYTIGNQRVFRKGSPGTGMSYAQAAKRAVELGGKYDGHEVAKDLNIMTKDSAKALAGSGLIGAAKDNYGRKGSTQAFLASFAEIEVDVETGVYKILDFLCVVDCGTVVNPRGLEGQLHGGAIQGIGYTRTQKWVYDQEYGLPIAKRFHYNRPPTILDIPEKMDWDAVNLPDPQTPVGAKGMAESAVGGGASVLRCALAAALGDQYLRRTPVGIDMIVASLDAKKRVDRGLTSNV